MRYSDDRSSFFPPFFSAVKHAGGQVVLFADFFGVIAIVDQTIELRMPCEILE